jgi:hypothetical protein
VNAQWQEESVEWIVDVKEGRTELILENRVEVLVDATGIFKFVILFCTMIES